jgi:dTDP-4-dehydrorhamnose 3,5-epimerase
MERPFCDLNSRGEDLSMKFIESELKGAFIIEPEFLEDERGFFARTFCKKEFEKHGLNPSFVQCSISFNRKKGTLRGMHYQISPFEEIKIVRCTMGVIYDVIIDLRPDSKTFMRWIAVELSAENRRMIYIPEGFAHGFLTRVDSTEVFYQMNEFYTPGYARGIRWNDQKFNIKWPDGIRIISAKDKNFEDFDPETIQ